MAPITYLLRGVVPYDYGLRTSVSYELYRESATLIRRLFVDVWLLALQQTMVYDLKILCAKAEAGCRLRQLLATGYSDCGSGPSLLSWVVPASQAVIVGQKIKS